MNGTTTWKYYYDYQNRLSSVTKNGVTAQNNTYSGDGNRVEQVFGGSSIVYTHQGFNILYEKNLTSSTITKHYYANGLQLGESYGSSMYYFLEDAMGNVRDVTTSSASTVFSSDYKPYGLNYGLSESLSIFNFEYTDKPYDSATGLYYCGARFYDPSIERFITEDYTKGSLEYPITLNRYAYVNDNPLAIIDPSGNSGWWSSITSAVSNVAGDVSSFANSASTEIVSAVSNPENQAILLTAAIDIGAGVAIGATGGAILATPAGGALLGAAISATSYTILSGSRANLEGAALSAGTGALVGGMTVGIGGLLEDGAESVAEEGASTTTSNAADTWVSPESLAQHFDLHGEEFGAQTQEEYAAQANQFLQRTISEQLPMKINLEDGLMYAYDSETRTFGAYTLPDVESNGGLSVTFHMADAGYFARQIGISPW